MPQPHNFDLPESILIALARPPCPKCRSRMWLSSIEPGEPGHDRRTYECIVCGHEMVKTVKIGDGQ